MLCTCKWHVGVHITCSWFAYKNIRICLNRHWEISPRFGISHEILSLTYHGLHVALVISDTYYYNFPTESSKHRSSSLSVPILRPSGSGSSLSPSTTPPSPHSPHQINGSNGLSSSLTRRIQRSRSTSLENGNELYRRVLKPLDQVRL